MVFFRSLSTNLQPKNNQNCFDQDSEMEKNLGFVLRAIAGSRVLTVTGGPKLTFIWF